MSLLSGKNGSPQSARIVVTADVALGRSNHWLPRGQQLGALLERRLAFGVVVNHVLSSHAQALVIAGGLFDDTSPEPAEIAAAVAGLGSLAEAGVACFAIHGAAETTPGDVVSPLDLLAKLDLLVCLDRQRESHIARLGGLRVAFTALLGADARGRDNPLRQLSFPRMGDCHVLVTDSQVEQLTPAGAPGPVIDLESVNALTGVSLLIANGPRPQRYQATRAMVVVPGSPLRPSPDGGFVDISVASGGVQDIKFESGAGLPAAEVLVPASLLELPDANRQIRKKIAESATEATEVVMRVYGRASPESLRRARLASLVRYGRSVTARFVLDVSGLLSVQNDAGRGPLAVLDEIGDQVAERDRSSWKSDHERANAIDEYKSLIAGRNGLGIGLR